MAFAIAAAFGIGADVGGAALILLIAALGFLPRNRAGWRAPSSFGWGLVLLAAALPLLLLGALRDDFSHLALDAIPTLRGARLGTPVSDDERDYEITDTGGLICGAAVPGPGETYAGLAGRNTVEFTSHRGVVWAITLLAGQHPHACRS